MRTTKDWGYEDLIHQGSGYAVKLIHLKEGCSTSLHLHEIKHETIIVHSGTLSILLQVPGENPFVVELVACESIAIAAKTIHKMTASNNDCIYFEAQTDHLDDVVRLSSLPNEY